MPLPLINNEYLAKLRHYIESGDLVFDFENASDEDKGDILDFLENIMDIAELADAAATRIIFKDAYLEAASGTKSER